MRFLLAFAVSLAAALLVYGCSGQGGHETPDSGADVGARDTGTTDSADVATACNCLGGTPFKVVENLSLDEVVGQETYVWPGLSGEYHPTPAGGWIISSEMNFSLESASGNRLTLVGPDGEVIWNDDCSWEDEWGTWTYHECPWVRAVLPDYFVTEYGGRETARDYAGNVAWKGAPPGYDDECLVTAPVVPGTTDRYRVESSSFEKSASDGTSLTRYTFSLVRCGGDGKFMYRVDVPGDFPAGFKTSTDDEGLLILFRSGEYPYPDDAYELDGVRVSFDGGISEPFPVIRWPVTSIERPLFYSQASNVSTGVLVMINFRQNSEDVLQTRAALVGADGTVVWTHDGAWSDGDYGMLQGTLVANADGTIDSLTSYINRDMDITLPRIRRIRADGSGLVFDRTIRTCPIGQFPNWEIHGRYDLDDGILLNGYCYIDRTDGPGQSLVALYDHDYRQLLWVKSYGPSSSRTSIVNDGDDWHLSWSVESSEWQGITGIPGMNMSIARFSGVCSQKDCGQVREDDTGTD